jgi:hypothetical protein
MYTPAVADSVILYLHHFITKLLKIKRKLYIASGSAPPPPQKKLKILRAHLTTQTPFKILHLMLFESFFRVKINTLNFCSTVNDYGGGSVRGRGNTVRLRPPSCSSCTPTTRNYEGRCMSP